MRLPVSQILIIADEPTTALDVTVQRQILDLLKRIAKETNTAVVLVSHDLGVIASMCSRVLVMQEGRIVEEGEIEQIFLSPVHPYTKKLTDLARELYQTPPKRVQKDMILKTAGWQDVCQKLSVWKRAVAGSSRTSLF